MYVTNYNHFSSPGLEHVKELYQNDMLPERTLTQQEVHYAASKAVEQGLSRVLLATIQANNNNVGQIKTLLTMSRDSSTPGTPNFFIENNPNAYINGIDDLKSLAGKEWVTSFEQKLDSIKSEKILDPRAPWHAAFHKFAFKNDRAMSEANNKELDYLLKTPTVAAITANPTIKPISSILTSMSSIRKNAENQNNSQHKLQI